MADKRVPTRHADGRAPAAPAVKPPVEDGLQEGTDLGAIRIHQGVIAVIARLAALKVPGVVEMSSSFAEGLAGMIGKNTFDRGVKVIEDEARVSVELHVVIEFGVRIPQVAWRIQNDVRRAIQEMTGKNVKAVDVIVQGVKAKDEPIAEGDIP